MARELESLEQELMRERAADVRSVARRARELAAPGGERCGEPDGPCVLLTDELGPADVVRLDPAMVLGIALAGGGATSHAAIVARSLGIPLVVGAGGTLLAVDDGRSVIVDGDSGQVVIDPDEAAAAGAREAMEAVRTARRRSAADREPAVTSDGRRVVVLCNAATEAEVVAGLESGAEGVGLLRTELPFLEAASWPTRRQHEDALRPLLDHLHGRPVTVRVLDFGGDKTPPFLRDAGTAGSALGPRGVRLLLDAPDAMAAQLSALLEAARGCQLSVMVPMVARADDLRLVRDALRSAAGLAPVPPLGAMVEVPAAALSADELVDESDFFSIGTNDLVQYTMAADREDPRLADLAVAHHPAVLRLIKRTVEAAHARGRRVTVCGEAAADPIAFPLLLGMGVDGLSVGANRVSDVRRRVRLLDVSRATTVAEEALESRSAGAVAALVAPLTR
jgi:phosphocarrier protein FPr